MINRILNFMFLVLISLQVLSCSDNDMVEPAPEPTPEPPVEEVPDVKNLALGGVATASSFDSGRAPFYLIDGKIEAAENQGYYSSVGSTENHTEWVQIELTKESEINSIWVYPRYDGIHAGFPVDFTLQTSVDGKQWNIVATGENHTEVTDALPRKYTFADVNAKFVRLVATNLYSANNEWTGYKDTYILQLAEIEVYKRVQSVSSVRLGSYFSVVGEQVEVSVDVETEQVKDNAGVTIELVAAEDGHSLETPVKQTGKLTDNKAAFVLKLSSTLSEGEYKVKATVEGDKGTSVGYSAPYIISAADGKTYYISSSRGNDENDGLSEDTPFKTLTKVSQLELKPGSKLLLRASDVWQRQMLMPKGSGTREKPIVIGTYGTGAKPIISPGYSNNTIYGIRIVNGSGYEIRGLEIMNCYGGIVFWYENTYNHKYILIEDCYVHQVTGTTTGWGGGWDQKMPVDLVMASGICINGSDAYGNSRICEDITIRNTKIDRCDVGIQFISRDHDFSGKWNYHGKDKTTSNSFYDVKITNCDVTRSYRTGGICISCVSKLDARDLLVDETGYQGIGMYWGVAGFQVSRVSDSLIENCTFSNTIKGSSPDGQGFDFESDNQNVTVRKCRFLNNDAAGLLCFGGTWPGANAGNVVDDCYFEGNNRVDDNRIFNIGYPANSGIVKNSEIHMGNKATTFYSYPLAFDESNRVYDAAGKLIYSGGPSRTNPMFEERFGSDLSKWKDNAAGSSVTSGKLSVENNRVVFAKGGSDWKNYFLEAEVTCKSEVAIPGLVFCADDSGKNYYIAKVNLLRNYRSTIDIYKVVNGTENTSPLASYPCYSMLKETAYKIRIELKDSSIQVYMDGNLMGTLTDAAFSKGTVGLANGHSGMALFDNLIVCPL
ncbi:discoidin domain-containing protein [Bacteroides ovatus]|uniref:discoidin domain-containing protein n=1 Tax=Bacteroides ovatus TaxID=28116 RepID=UPI0022E0BCC9|nr:discoidin domain-containing protein [Bacteroides ovatus]